MADIDETGDSGAAEPAESTQPGAREMSSTSERPKRPLVAGVLLLFLVGLGLFHGIFQISSPGEEINESLRFSDIRWTVQGTVHAPNGTALAGATVVSNQAPEHNATTNETGSYRIGGLAAGFNSLNFSHPETGNLTLNLVLLQDATADVEMPPAGRPAVVDHHSVADQRTIARTWGVVVLVLTIATAAGAVATYRRGPRKLAIAGCVTGFLVGLFAWDPLGLIIAPAALFLVLRDRSDWR